MICAERHGSLRDNGKLFRSVLAARVVLAEWVELYNTIVRTAASR